jgi:hypothetical protein
MRSSLRANPSRSCSPWPSSAAAGGDGIIDRGRPRAVRGPMSRQEKASSSISPSNSLISSSSSSTSGPLFVGRSVMSGGSSSSAFGFEGSVCVRALR